ncbi:MAG: hypothetical protein KBD78_01270 [Oligoflexales bacterium]|nr:hypothetical protein [Oligoflexales bacterium]
MKSLKKFLSACFLGLILSQVAAAQDTDPNLAVFGFYTLYDGAKEAAPGSAGVIYFYANPANPSQIVGEFATSVYNGGGDDFTKYTISNVVLTGSKLTADWNIVGKEFYKGVLEINFYTAPDGIFFEGFEGKIKTTVYEDGTPVSLESQASSWEASIFSGKKI